MCVWCPHVWIWQKTERGFWNDFNAFRIYWHQPWITVVKHVKLCLAQEAMPVPAPVPVPRKKVAAQKDSQRRGDDAANDFGFQKDSGSKSFKVIILKISKNLQLQQPRIVHPKIMYDFMWFHLFDIYIARLEYEPHGAVATPRGRAAEQLPAGPVMALRGFPKLPGTPNHPTIDLI